MSMRTHTARPFRVCTHTQPLLLEKTTTTTKKTLEIVSKLHQKKWVQFPVMMGHMQWPLASQLPDRVSLRSWHWPGTHYALPSLTLPSAGATGVHWTWLCGNFKPWLNSLNAALKSTRSQMQGEREKGKDIIRSRPWSPQKRKQIVRGNKAVPGGTTNPPPVSNWRKTNYSGTTWNSEWSQHFWKIIFQTDNRL